MTCVPVTRRAVLGAGAGAAATLVLTACDKGEAIPPITLPPATPPAPGSELLAVRRLLLAERLQLHRWQQAALLLPRRTAAADPRRATLDREVAVEARHVAAIADLVQQLGGTDDPFRPGATPATLPAALAQLRRVERICAGAWLAAAQTFVGLETRTAALSLAGPEIRQLGVLDRLAGRPVSAAAPPAVAVDRAMAALGRAIGPVPRA